MNFVIIKYKIKSNEFYIESIKGLSYLLERIIIISYLLIIIYLFIDLSQLVYNLAN